MNIMSILLRGLLVICYVIGTLTLCCMPSTVSTFIVALTMTIMLLLVPVVSCMDCKALIRKLMEDKYTRYVLINEETKEELEVSENTFHITKQLMRKFDKERWAKLMNKGEAFNEREES